MVQNNCTFLCKFCQFEAADRLQSFDQDHFIFGIDFGNFHNTKSSCLSNQSTHASNIVTCNNNTHTHPKLTYFNFMFQRKCSILFKIKDNQNNLIRTALNWPNGIAKIVGFHFVARQCVFNIFQCQLIFLHSWIFWQRRNALYFGWKWWNFFPNSELVFFVLIKRTVLIKHV